MGPTIVYSGVSINLKSRTSFALIRENISVLKKVGLSERTLFFFITPAVFILPNAENFHYNNTKTLSVAHFFLMSFGKGDYII